MLSHSRELRKTQNFNSLLLRILETHIVPAITEEIRLQEYAPGIFQSIPTRSGVKKAIKRGEILVDGVVAKTSDWVKEHQKIQLIQHEVKEKKIFELKFPVIFEDEHLAVIDKPSGYPTSGNYFRTIENALPFNLKPSEAIDALPYPVPVHRLDNPTSGLLLVAKTRKVRTKLHLAFEKREVEKTYVAIVSGETPALVEYLDPVDHKPAKSKILTLNTFDIQNKKFSLIEVIPESGRTHQIRIHLSSNGFPIIGDKEYGTEEIFVKDGGLFLAAVKLSLAHPVTGEKLLVQLDLPGKFVYFIEVQTKAKRS